MGGVTGVEAAFEARFGSAPAACAAAPGRVNLIGEHTDYTGGWVLPTALSLELRVAVRFRDDRRVRADSRELGAAEADLDAGRAGDWLDYPRGVARALLEAGRIPRRGFEIQVESDLPQGAGLSSSAALEVATGLALAAAAGGRFRQSEGVELAKLCQRAESDFVGVPCGILDPFAIACAPPGSAILLRCADLHWRPIAVDFEIAVFDTGARRELRAGGYAARTRECAEGLHEARRLLGREVAELAALSQADLPALESGMDPVLFRRVRHVVSENARVHGFTEALARGDRAALGEAMYASHASLRDDYEASWPEADFLVERAQSTEGVIGARMTGAGWGGCTVQLLGDDGPGDTGGGANLDRLGRDFEREFGRELRVFRVASAAGARLLSPA